MNFLSRIPPEHVEHFLSNGSPTLVRAAGRVLGLGNGEQNELAKNGLPTWFWVTASLGVGVLAGLYLQQSYPAIADKMFGRKR